MTIQLELDLQFKTSYICDLLDLFHESAKRGSKLPYREKDMNNGSFTALMNQILDLSWYASSANIIDNRQRDLIQESILSSISLFWSV